MKKKLTGVICSLGMILLAGCAGTFGGNGGPQLVTTTGMHGQSIGGRQPISGANIYLYAASTSGYATAGMNVLSTPVTTNPDGTFYIASITCTAGQQMYIVSLGGNPGDGTNPNAGIMAALGDCANLGQYSFININEVTTVAAAFALSPFSGGYGNVGTSSTNTTGLAHAFASAAKLANVVTGSSLGTALLAGATGPSTEINTHADALAGCGAIAGCREVIRDDPRPLVRLGAAQADLATAFRPQWIDGGQEPMPGYRRPDERRP